MAIVIEDFVNREQHLEILWQALRQEVNGRIILVSGVEGAGKTYLLDEYRSECRAAGVSCVWIDFAEGTNHNYLEIVRAVRNEFDEGFAHLDETIKQTRALGRWKNIPTPPFAFSATSPLPSPGQPGTRSGGVDFLPQRKLVATWRVAILTIFFK